MSYRSGLQMFAIMTNWKTEFHKPLTRPGVKHDEEMSICSSTPQAHRGYINSSLLESDLKMSESHANVVSFDENVSTMSNLYERNEHLLMNETTVENMTTIGTVYESMMRNQRTYLANQDNKHRLEDECTDFSLNTSRNGVGEVSKRSRTAILGHEPTVINIGHVDELHYVSTIPYNEEMVETNLSCGNQYAQNVRPRKVLEAAKYHVETSELFQNEHIEVQENWLNNINSAPISEHDDWEEFVNSSTDQTDELHFSEPIEEPANNNEQLNSKAITQLGNASDCTKPFADENSNAPL
nr:uncharacterized protein LOC131800254 [Pocillopora verrucosa]